MKENAHLMKYDYTLLKVKKNRVLLLLCAQKKVKGEKMET